MARGERQTGSVTSEINIAFLHLATTYLMVYPVTIISYAFFRFFFFNFNELGLDERRFYSRVFYAHSFDDSAYYCVFDLYGHTEVPHYMRTFTSDEYPYPMICRASQDMAPLMARMMTQITLLMGLLSVFVLRWQMVGADHSDPRIRILFRSLDAYSVYFLFNEFARISPALDAWTPSNDDAASVALASKM